LTTPGQTGTQVPYAHSIILMRCQTGDLKRKDRLVRERSSSQEKSPPNRVERAISNVICSGKSLPVSVQHLGSKRFAPHKGRFYTSNFYFNSIISEFCQIKSLLNRLGSLLPHSFPDGNYRCQTGFNEKRVFCACLSLLPLLFKTFTLHHPIARIFHELQSRDREDGRVTGQPQELGSEAYLNSTSQGSRSEDDWRTAISAVAVGHS